MLFLKFIRIYLLNVLVLLTAFFIHYGFHSLSLPSLYVLLFRLLSLLKQLPLIFMSRLCYVCTCVVPVLLCVYVCLLTKFNIWENYVLFVLWIVCLISFMMTSSVHSPKNDIIHSTLYLNKIPLYMHAAFLSIYLLMYCWTLKLVL